MFDARLRPLIDPPLNAAGRWLARIGVGANAVTLAGIALGLAAGATIAQSCFEIGLALIVANRLLDGLDGAVARATSLTDFGGFLDIVGDFVFYIAVPVGFGLASPQNLLPALLLVASFALTGASFLAFAAIAGKRGLETAAHGRKSLFYNTGLAEGAETIAAFIAMVLMPQHFGTIALIFAALCVLTVIQRSLVAFHAFAAACPEEGDE
ncbi:CDP-alcohol phosphatidyltransferase family protein [Novosphingobium sp.]|uniref:CDP-alcohol phosphatidyltransferase family protein n=1 Tax=Novosphingobium sp. TaxID=1874826 RepID=UPI0027365596|nr:CDP-alcohol phosphatidyltransferase family protein [Novosphingobium sp.]MDP3906736.1 CDP-alcohol phosphatidyltransferase family protein [Novosphingobium sp.]